MKLPFPLLFLTLLADINAADDPRMAARKLAREAAVQSAGIDKALSREMPDELKALPVFGEIVWTVKEMPFIAKGPHAGVSGAGMVVVGGKIYFAGGFIPEGDKTQDTAYRTSRWAHCYDPATDQWTQLPDLPARREYTRAIATEDAVYVLGGAIQDRPTLPSAEVYRLDVTRTPLAWQTVAPLTVPVTHMAADRAGSFMIVAGGNNYDIAEKGYSPKTIQGVTNVLDLAKPGHGWQQRAPIPGSPRGWTASAVAGGKFYMLGGVTWNEKGRQRLQEALSYDPAKNEWQRLADFPYSISGWEGETFDNRYIIAVGGAGARWNDLPFVYDTQENRWLRSTSPLPPGAMFNDPGVCIIGDTIYVAGGEGSGGSHFNHFLVGKIKPKPLPVAKPFNIASRWELFVDEYLVAEKSGVALKLHEPVKREVVLTTDQPWEGPTCGYFSAIQDGEKVRLYYRGSAGGSDHSADQVTCVVESNDGIHFTRPKLGLIEAGGTKDNNVIWRGVESHNFAAFLDTNPKAKPGERYKGLGGVKEPGKNWMTGETPGGLYAFASPDGLRWHKISPQMVMTKGAFDSQNVAFWDAPRKRYASYTRIFTNKIRDIQSSHSADFLTWSDATLNRYAADVQPEHFYTSATVPCPGAPHLLLSFPKRYVVTRQKITEHKFKGVSDAVFMSSRDGVNWSRAFREAWVRPGPDPKNWTDRNQMTAAGIIETAPNEWSLYVSEHYRSADHRMRRVTVRKQGFASMHANAKGGEFTTRPLTFTGSQLILNYATSAAGSVQIEALDESGKVLATMAELYGDELEAKALDVSALKGKAIRLRVKLKDADLYAMRFAD
ncbi:kelch repeat-containing protein [Prosthecobacter sp.]|uniref:kelch repeat-containing protein n=1 Tax=Prosthecobacter sp. TaxID=1965333 RepID=UPI002ABA3A81|nr:kelch repeat-containing protein [Prosthecobacter sp.]MDZ4403246.1 kelch repeat-containing protein [Prosthecobacter sp.]